MQLRSLPNPLGLDSVTHRDVGHRAGHFPATQELRFGTGPYPQGSGPSPDGVVISGPRGEKLVVEEEKWLCLLRTTSRNLLSLVLRDAPWGGNGMERKEEKKEGKGKGEMKERKRERKEREEKRKLSCSFRKEVLA